MLTGNEFQTLGAEINKHKIQKIGCDGGRKLMRTGWAQRPRGSQHSDITNRSKVGWSNTKITLVILQIYLPISVVWNDFFISFLGTV